MALAKKNMPQQSGGRKTSRESMPPPASKPRRFKPGSNFSLGSSWQCFNSDNCIPAAALREIRQLLKTPELCINEKLFESVAHAVRKDLRSTYRNQVFALKRLRESAETHLATGFESSYLSFVSSHRLQIVLRCFGPSGSRPNPGRPRPRQRSFPSTFSLLRHTVVWWLVPLRGQPQHCAQRAPSLTYTNFRSLSILIGWR